MREINNRDTLERWRVVTRCQFLSPWSKYSDWGQRLPQVISWLSYIDRRVIRLKLPAFLSVSIGVHLWENPLSCCLYVTQNVLRPQSSRITRLAFLPAAPMIPPPGWVLAPVKYRPRIGPRYWCAPSAGRWKNI